MDDLKNFKTHNDSGKEFMNINDMELLEKTLKNYEQTICRQKLEL